MTRRPLLLLTSLALAAGCAGDPIDPAAITYQKDVRAVVESSCLSCHSEGGIAPFTLTSYADVEKHKAAIKIAVRNRVMPPWPPGKGCTDYVADRSLSDAAIDTVVKWVDEGALEGDPTTYVKPQPVVGAALTRVDRTLKMVAPYMPVKTPDDYRCFIMDWPEATDTYVTGFRANPGNAQIVHHVIAYLAPPAMVAQYQKLDDDEAGPGYTCFGGPGGNQGDAAWLGGWAPGSLGTDFPPNTGVKVAAGSKVILQVHYNLSTTAPAPDQTGVDFKVDTNVTTQAVVQPWTNIDWVRNKQMVIPAGMKDVMHSYTFDPSPFMNFITNDVIPANQPFTMYSASLHMHTRGVSGKMEIVHPDGSRECLLNIPRWDFHWQGGYGFVKSKTFKPGDSIYLECHWDNSTTTTDVNWGEGTGDEMCLGGFYITK
jgi:hypothetical protein